ncbi:MAG: electron transfer flavoprotein subunit beta [Microbacteriaceae bacterium]|nr:electron transfer flavoprotein subunit beta [Microbacteriaceae bacterium]
MKIVVLIKQVPDTYEDRKLNTATGILERDASEKVIDDVSERALEVALTYKDGDKSTEVVALSMGPASTTDSLRKALASGADSAVHVLDEGLDGSDLGWTASALAAAITRTGFDVVIAGNESTDGRGGVIPAMLAERLGIAHLSYLNSVDLTDSTASGIRSGEDGTSTVHVALPAVLSVTDRNPEPRFPNFKGIMGAKKKPLETVTVADLGIDPAFPGLARSVVLSTVVKPAKTAGTKVVDEGNAGVELADFLAAQRLI